AAWWVAVVGCGPWLTPIPAYWQANDVRVRGEETPTPVVAIEATPATSRPTSPPVEPPAPKSCTAVYLTSEENELLPYHLDEGAIDERGTLACPASFRTPSSMAVGCDGLAHVLYTSEELFEVDLATPPVAACPTTPRSRPTIVASPWDTVWTPTG